MKVSGQLKEASLEVLTEDPTNVPLGRVWFDKVANLFKIRKNATTEVILTNSSVIDTSNIGDAKVTTAKIGNAQVTTDKIADGAIQTVKIADGSVTSNKLSARNIVVSALNSYFQTTSQTMVSVPSLSVNITTTGRPVIIGLISGTSYPSSFGVSTTTSGYNASFAIARIVRVGEIASWQVGGYSPNGSGVGSVVPASSMFTIDTPAAGTHNYALQLAANLGGTAFIQEVKLFAMEL